MLCRIKNSLANSLLPSSSAPLLEGPITITFFNCSSALKKSVIPKTKGSSGPTTTISILLSSTNNLIASKSVGFKSTFSAISAVPALPGATNNFEQ